MKPWEFRQLEADKRAELMATYIVDRQVEGYYNSEQMKRMDRERAKAESERNGGHSIKGGGSRKIRPNQ